MWLVAEKPRFRGWSAKGVFTNNFVVPRSVEVIGSLLKMSTLDVRLTGRTEESSLAGFGDKSVFQIEDVGLGTSNMSISDEDGILGRRHSGEGDFEAILAMILADIMSQKARI